MKREFLVEEPQELHGYLEKNSNFLKIYHYAYKKSCMYNFDDFTYVLEEYVRPLLGINILVLISKEEKALDEKIKNFEEITNDKRYSKKYLKLFGNPKNYDFEVDKVFAKCDSVGLERMNLHFVIGMSGVKVFRVLLYRLNQIFTMQYEAYLKKDAEYEDLQEAHKKLNSALLLSKKIFNKRTIKHLLEDFADLYMLLNHTDTYERYALNFQTFIKEDNFYNTSKTDKPIYFFDEKEKVFKLAQNIQKEKNL